VTAGAAPAALVGIEAVSKGYGSGPLRETDFAGPDVRAKTGS
jgi:hypothetical protein